MKYPRFLFCCFGFCPQDKDAESVDTESFLRRVADVDDRKLPTMDNDPVLKCFKSNDIQEARRSLSYLYEKKLLSSFRSLRREQLQQIIFPSNTSILSYHYLQELRKLSGDILLNSLPNEVQSIEAFYRSLPSWNHRSTSYVWLRDYFKSDFAHYRSPLQRSSESRLCYLQAPVLLIAYLQRKRKMLDVKMIDSVRWLKSPQNSDICRQHLFPNEGVDSRGVLKRFTKNKDDTIIHVQWDQIDETHLQQYGPGLVDMLLVCCNFEKPGLFQYDEEHARDDSEVVGYQSMILLGVRTQEIAGTTRKKFLLQGWKKDKQFIECSDSFLRSRNATCYFVRAEHVLSVSPTAPGIYAETGEIDHAIILQDM